MQITLQQTSVSSLEQLLFDVRAENSRLHETFYALQVEIERLYRARKRVKVLINVNEEIMKK
jgi:hypothetical protein